MGTGLGILAADGPDFMIHGLVKFHLFGQELWLTTTHVSVLVVCVLLIIFALIVRSKLRDTEGEPGTLQNIAEMVVEALDGLPPVKLHCSVLAEQAVKAALADYYRRQGVDPEPIVGKLEEDCHACACEA